MSKYRKVETRIWNDAKFMALSDDGKLVFFLVLTHPAMTSVGAMRASMSSLSEDLGWPLERLSKGFTEGLAKGLLEYDFEGRLVALPNFFRYNKPENPNVLRGWTSALDLLPECRLKTLTMQRIETLSEGLTEGFRKALPKAFTEALCEALANQEQEQEPEQEQIDPKNPNQGISEPSSEQVSASVIDLTGRVAR